jgi:Nif-specific regulatory protein
MPPLRDRKEDIPLLTKYFLNLFSSETGLQNLEISNDAMERAVVMGNKNEILPEDLPIGGHTREQPGLEIGLSLKEALDKFKKEFIRINLEHSGGNRSKAARVMKIQRTYLSRLISQYKI